MAFVYTGPRDIVEKYVDVYRASIPGDMASDDRDLDDAMVFAEMAALGEGAGFGWAREARLSTSHGIWTDQHGHDRGLSRQQGEADSTFVSRLKTGPKAVTLEPIREAISQVVTAADPLAPFYIVRVPVDNGAFAETDCWCDADSRVTPSRPRYTIVIIPAELDSIKTSILDALRAKMPAGHLFAVEELTPVSVFAVEGDSNGVGIAVVNNADGGFLLNTPSTTVQMDSHRALGVAFPPVFSDLTGALRPYANPNDPSMGIELTMGPTLFTAGGNPLMAIMAISGATLATEWLPTSTYPAAGDGNLHNLFVARMLTLGTVRAVTVHLGTNDANTSPMATAFQANMTASIAALRAAFGAGLIVAWVKTNVNCVNTFTSTVRTAQDNVVALDPLTVLVPNDDLSLTDGYHYFPAGYIIIGQRAAFLIADKLGLARQTVATTPAVIGWGPAANGAGALSPISWPGTLVGDLEIGVGTSGLAAGAQTTPTGWTLIAGTNLTSVFSGLDQQVAVYCRNGSNGGAATTFADTNNFNSFKCFTIRGPNAMTTANIDDVDGAVNNDYSTTPLTIPSITTTVANELVLIITGAYSGSGTNGFTATSAGLSDVRLIQSGTYAIGSDYQVIAITSGSCAVAGATGTAIATPADNVISVGLQIGIKP